MSHHFIESRKGVIVQVTRRLSRCLGVSTRVARRRGSLCKYIPRQMAPWDQYVARLVMQGYRLTLADEMLGSCISTWLTGPKAG